MVLCFLLGVPAFATETRMNPPSLDVILGRLSRSAELFRDAALQFTSEEKISWRGIGMSPGTEMLEYHFVHDAQRGFEDYRTARFFGNRQSVPAEVVPSDLGVPMFLCAS